MEPHSYNVSLQWKEMKKGLLQVPNVAIEVPVATPLPFTGGVDNEWSPEHLFIASVSSCFMTTFIAIAENSKLYYESFNCDAKGVLAIEDGKYKITHVYLYPNVALSDESKNELAIKVLEKSKKACLISNSINSEVIVESNIR
jgi:peroxiredoxin-like protein